jgi:hypothetical protein
MNIVANTRNRRFIVCQCIRLSLEFIDQPLISMARAHLTAVDIFDLFALAARYIPNYHSASDLITQHNVASYITLSSI